MMDYLSRWRKWLLALLIPITLLVALLLFRQRISLRLEDWTGETELRQQIEGLYLRFRQRKINTQDMIPIAYAGVNPYGANTFFEQEVEEWKLRQSMEMLRDAGVRWIRQEMPWDRIEIPQKGQYINPYGSSWEHYDRFIDLANEYGLNIIARLDLPPSWAKTDNSVPRSPPDNLEDYGDFVYSFVKRYKGKIKYYQIWNEPNLYGEWGSPPDAAKYVELLKIGYRRAKEADPEVVILSAPLSPTLGTPDGLNESDIVYLQKMYDAGAKDYFDILSAQGHGLWTGPGDRRTEESQTNLSRLLLLREVMVRNGDANKAVWVSELGWDAPPPDFPGPATHGRVTEERQARYTVAAYERAQQEWPWVGVSFYWYFRRVSDESRKEVDFYYRMVDPDFTPRPVYYAYKELTTLPLLVHRGYHQEDHWALSYEGSWSKVENEDAVLGAYTASSQPGNLLTFRFEGTELTLVTFKGNYMPTGKLYIEVDGSPHRANMLPVDVTGRAYIDLSIANVQVPIASGLKDAEHSVRIEVGDGTSAAIDAFIVDRVPTSPWRLGFGVTLAVLAIALVLTFCLRIRLGGL